jgi:3-dehydro-4-phosphotetronate decarboxylase
MNETQAREEICRVGNSLFARGYVHATAGNISVRLEDGFLITPTDACLGDLDPAQIAYVDFAGQHARGDHPSKTLALHRKIYEATGQWDSALGAKPRCVIHTHSTHCVALTLRAAPSEELLAPITPYFVMKVGHVPLIPYYRPGDAAAAENVAQVILRYAFRGLPLRAAMLARLGPNVWHETPASTMAVLEELEETAKLACLSPSAIAPLTQQHIEALRQTFGAYW